MKEEEEKGMYIKKQYSEKHRKEWKIVGKKIITEKRKKYIKKKINNTKTNTEKSENGR